MERRDVAITLAGGGNRAFYQMGLLNRWGSWLLPRVGVMATCSAGACVALLVLSGRQREAHSFWKARRRGIRRNFSVRRALHGQRPMPHAEIYRETLLVAMAEGGFERVREQPFPILVLTTAPPAYLPLALSVPLGLLVYNTEKRLYPERLHPTFGRRFGFAPAVFDARRCETAGELADLILASSATPPFTPVGKYDGKVLLDGGLVDNAPAFLGDGGEGIVRNVVLLTRAVASERRGARLYLAPSRAVPIATWDYTNPEGLDATLAMGEAEGVLHEPMLRGFLGELGEAQWAALSHVGGGS